MKALPLQQQTPRIVFSRIDVPRHDGSVVEIPPYQDLPALTLTNLEAARTTSLDLQGKSLEQLRAEVRREVLALSVQYTGGIHDHAIAAATPGPLIVTGHQPELFHAGVWAKNFATAGIAQQVSGTPVNLIIDNDTVASTQIRVPIGPRENPSLAWVPLDIERPEHPWEELNVIDKKCFTDFGHRVHSLVQDNWGYRPLIADSWSAAMRQMEKSPRMSDCLTAARMVAEHRMGLRNLEVPMSQVCSSRSFFWFAAYLLLHLPRFHRIYNQAIREYRQVHRLRSLTHPVPELESQGEWLEIPFWSWRPGDQRRDRPFVRTVGRELELRDHRGWTTRLPVGDEKSLSDAVVALEDLAKQGLRLRTRALTTTLFARLCLADLFVHGIGGAKYDAMTDLIAEEFFGIVPPRFATISATVFLPLGPAFSMDGSQLRSLQHAIRDCQYNPQRHMSQTADEPLKEVLSRKQQLLTAIAGRRPTKREHYELNTATRRLAPLAEPDRRKLLEDKAVTQRKISANKVLQSREYAWCLHPAERLQAFMEREFIL